MEKNILGEIASYQMVTLKVYSSLSDSPLLISSSFNHELNLMYMTVVDKLKFSTV